MITVPAYLLAWCVLTALAPLWVPLGGLHDLVTRRSSLHALAFAWIYLGCELLGVFAATMLTFAPGDGEAQLRRHFRLQIAWARALRQAAFGLFRVRVTVAGDDAAATGPMLLLVRHCSLGDTLLPMMLVSEPHGIVLRWVLKRELLWDPCLNIVGHRLRNAFVGRSGTPDVQAIVELSHRLGHDGVAIYPEGTRFSAAKHAQLEARARARGDEALARRVARYRHVLPIRPSGTLALLEHNPGLDVVFCAHRGLEASASPRTLFNGELLGARVHIELWRVPAHEIPADREARLDWLDDQWTRVDEVASGR